MGSVLGRVVATGTRTPRGPDTFHRIAVARGCLTEGAAIEVELPRNLTCAGCDGGGCDACDRSGAITIRGRGDPPDLVPVNLPAGDRDAPFVIRIPEYGGLPAPGSEMPRGHLFLRVEPSSQMDPSVRLVEPRGEMSRVASGVRPASKIPAARRKFVAVGAGVAVAIVIAVTILTLLWRP